MPTVTDHLGKEYPSVRAMCDAYGIPQSTYNNRMLRGWTKEQALTLSNKSTSRKVNHQKIWKDHLGNEYVSVNDMCSHYGITDKIFWSRKRILKWPLEKILTTPVQKQAKNSIHITDHLGNEFESICAMCDFHHIGWSTYRERRKMGWTIEEALTGKIKSISIKSQECEDHLGNKYESLNAMCRAYSMSRYMYSSRIKMGWSQEKALTEPYITNNHACEDASGHEFPTLKDMANYYMLPEYALQGLPKNDSQTFLKRLESKLKSRLQNVKIKNVFVERCAVFPYFFVKENGMQILMHYDTIMDIYHDSDLFNPVPESETNKDLIRILKRATFPYYLAEVNSGDPEVYSYWELIRINMESNFGLKKIIKDNKKTANKKER